MKVSKTGGAEESLFGELAGCFSFGNTAAQVTKRFIQGELNERKTKAYTDLHF